MKCPKILSPICGLYFLSEFCRNACLSPDHWWCAICSQADGTGPVHSNLVQNYSKERAEYVIPCCSVLHRHQSRNSSVIVKVSSTPRINMASWAISVISVLSSIATEKAINYLILSFIWLPKSPESSVTLSATVFFNRLMLAKADRFPGNTNSAAFSMHVFTNSNKSHEQ